mgnify:FL=1
MILRIVNQLMKSLLDDIRERNLGRDEPWPKPISEETSEAREDGPSRVILPLASESMAGLWLFL